MLVRRLARPMLASIFVVGGLDSARQPAGKAPAAEKINVGPVAEKLGLSDTTSLVRANGAAQVVGGLALALGRLPRLAALGLAASLVPTTLAGHRFWELDEPAGKAAQQMHFVKNLSILGGLLLAAVDTGGRESLGHKASRKSHELVGALPGH